MSEQTKQTGTATLRDGREATIRRTKGRDLQNAMRITTDPQEQILVLAASSATVDGQPVNYEDFLDWDMADCMAVVNAHNQLLGNG